MPKRKTPPLGVLVDALCLHFLDVTRAGVEFDHTPPLAMREVRPDGTDWIPSQHDPRHLTPRLKAQHREKTHGRRGESKLSSTGDGDQSRIAKMKRLQEAEEARSRDFARKLFPKTYATIDRARAEFEGPTSSPPARPARKIPSRPFPKTTRKIRT
jgi:hypothetical protein